MSAVPSDPEGRPIAEPIGAPISDPISEPPAPAPAPTAPTRPLSRNVTPHLTSEEVSALRRASFAKLFERWNGISHKYGMIAPEEDDEIDLITGEITCDRGRIRALKTRAFARELPFVEGDDDDDDDEGDDEEDEGDDSDTPMPPQDDDATPEPEARNGTEEGHPLSQEQPWTAEDDRDLEEFMKVERMRRLATGEAPQDEPVPAELDMGLGANMGPGQMDVIAMLVRREVERMSGGGGLQPASPVPNAAAQATANGAPAATNSGPPQSNGSNGLPTVSERPAVANHRQVERTASLSRTPTPDPSVSRSASSQSIPSASKNGSTPRPPRLSLSASKVRFADGAPDTIPDHEAPLSHSEAKGKGRMAGERPNEDGNLRRQSAPPPRSSLSVEITRKERRASEGDVPERQSGSPSPLDPADPPKKRRKRRISDEEVDANGERAKFTPPNVYLKSLSYHEGKLRECRYCLDAGEPRSRYAALCRGRIDESMCRFPQMTEEEVKAAIAYREEEEANYAATQKPEARTKKRTKLAPPAEVVTEIPTSWRPRPGDERYSMAPHRVRGGSFKRCKLCVVAGGVREKRSMFCMGRSGYGKCAFEFEDPSGSSGDEEETPEQAAIKQMEHRSLRAQNARMGMVARVLKKEEVPAAPLRKSTTPYVSYRQQSTRPGSPATRGPSKAPEGEELNPRAPNGRLKPRCGPCSRAGGKRAERAFLCPGSGRPKYCEYAPSAPGQGAMAGPSEDDTEATDNKDSAVEAETFPDPEIEFIVQQPLQTPAKSSAKPESVTPASGKKPTVTSANKAKEHKVKEPKPKELNAKKKKRPRNSRLGMEESSAEDYETEESDHSLSFADSDDSADSSASEDGHIIRRYNRESTGYTLQSDESQDLSVPLDYGGADAADDEFEGVDTSMESAMESAEAVDPQILRTVAAGMDDFVPRPNTNKYAPYLSFSDGGEGWATCASCEAAGGSRAECAMWCYGRDGEHMCRSNPGWVPPEPPRSRRESQRMSSAERGDSPFSPEHSPDPLESDVEMDDIVPIGDSAVHEGGETEPEIGDSSFDSEPAPIVRRSPVPHSTPPPNSSRESSAHAPSHSPPRITVNGSQPPSTQYRDPAAFVASSDPAPSSSPRSAASYASPLPHAADGLQAALARSIKRDYLATSPRRTQQT